ncbi:MAG: nucleoside monophosphate kinase [Bacilli bacterium]|nr:nucleoside monophosphate kinase [Bacilli bacterium]
MRNLILIAAPGAGKGTLSNDLLKKYDYVHISTGDLLREQVAKGDELGKEIAKVQESGGLVSNEIVYKALENKLSDKACDNGYILDGFPRNLEQALEYENILKKSGRDLGVVIVLDIPKEELIERITGRYICESCGEIHNIYNDELKPKKEGICNKCGGKLMQRKDDNRESFEARYETYLKNTLPLIDYYKKKNVLHVIDSSKGHVYTLEQAEKIIK